jgi:prophage regulatory protein
MDENKNVFRMPDVINATKLSKSTLYKLMTENRFPKNFKLSGRASGWLASDVYSWIYSKKNKS